MTAFIQLHPETAALLHGNPFVVPAIVALVLVLLVARWPKSLIGTHSRPELIHPKNSLPLIGNTLLGLQLYMKQKRILTEFLKVQQDEGRGAQPVTTTFPATGWRQIMLNMPEYIHYCQKTDFESFIKGKNFYDRLSDILGEHGIFVADGDIWKRQRKMASNIFSVSNFRTCVQNTIQHDLDVMLTLLANAEATNDTPINLPDTFFRFTLSSFSQIAFSADVECLPLNVDGLVRRNEFADAFDFAQLVADRRFVSPWPVWTEVLTPQGWRLRKALSTLKSYCYRIIDLRLAARASGNEQGAVSSKNGKDLLELFMDSGLSRDELLPIVLNFIIAGRDTTAQSLSWAFYRFWQHPEVVGKIRQELQETFGDELNERHMTYDDMKSLPYLQAAFLEALRLNPSVPKNVRQAARDTVIRPYATNDINAKRDMPGGGVPRGQLPDVRIRKGESVVWSDYVMARMPEIWGPDCEEFKPERFLEPREDDASKMRIRNYPQAVFHAFNGGPRVCLGQTLATYEGMAVIAAILTRFDVIYDAQALHDDPPRYADSLTHPIENQYYVRLRARSL